MSTLQRVAVFHIAPRTSCVRLCADEYPREKFCGRKTEKPKTQSLATARKVANPYVSPERSRISPSNTFRMRVQSRRPCAVLQQFEIVRVMRLGDQCCGRRAVQTSAFRPGVSLRIGLVKEARDLGKLFEVDPQTVVALAHVVRCGNADKVRLVDRIILTLRP